MTRDLPQPRNTAEFMAWLQTSRANLASRQRIAERLCRSVEWGVYLGLIALVGAVLLRGMFPCG